jgi:hypothetical protein
LAALALALGVSRVDAASLFPSGAFSNKAVGTTAAAFLKLPNGARYEALGGAGSALVEGADSLFWNPAGLGRFDAETPSDLSVSYSNLLEGAYTGGVGYARPRLGPGSLGLGLVYFSQASLTGYTSVGDPNGSFTPNDLALSAAYGLTLGRVRAGLTLKMIRSVIAEQSATTAAIDAGIQAERVADLGDGALDLGASFSNLGPPMKLGSEASPLPFSMRGGAVWHASRNFNAILDVIMPVDQDPYVAIGGEAYVKQPGWTGSVRLGFNQARASGVDGLTALTAGAGLDLTRFRIDYAWVPYGDLGMTNRVTLAFRF